MATEPLFSTRIDATGPRGNVFVVLGTARWLLGELKVERALIEDMTARVLAAHSYADALAVVREWFPVDTPEQKP